MSENVNIIHELHKAKDELKDYMHTEISLLQKHNAVQDGKIDRLMKDVQEIDHKISPPDQDGDTMRLSIVYDEIKKLRAFKKLVWTAIAGAFSSALYAIWNTMAKH